MTNKFSLLLFLIASIVFLSGCSDEENNENGSNNDDRVRTTVVETSVLQKTEYSDYIRITGSLEAVDDALISAQTSGRVLKIAERGQRVNRGDIIAEIDDELLQASFKVAKANYELVTDIYTRQQPLHADSIVSTQEFNQIIAQKEQEDVAKDNKEDQTETTEEETKSIHYTDSVIDQLINTTPTNTDLNFKKAGKQRKAPILDFNELPQLKSYELHQGVNMGSREDFLDASDKQIQKLLFDIVKTESPIYWRNLMRCFASYWQIQRLSQNVEAILFRGISSLLETKKIFAKDGCLYDNPQFNFKVRNRADTIAYHRPDELPIDECEMALFMVMEQFYPIPLARLYDAAAHILGFKRADRVLEEQFRKALSRMAQQETVQEGDYGLQLKPSLYKSSMRMPKD